MVRSVLVRPLCGFALFLVATSSIARAKDNDRLTAAEHDRESQASALCKSLPGYDEFEKEFRFHDATIGFINSAPESLYVRVQAKTSRTVDAAWWWNPIDSKKRPTLGWSAFRTTYDRASRVISRHRWLAAWKQGAAGRSIELWVIGRGIGQPASEIRAFVLPAWRDAGLGGKPDYVALARRPSGGSSTIYFSSREPRALITTNFVYPGDKGDQFWMSRKELSFHPKGKRDESYSKYFVVEPDGRRDLRTYGKATPGNGKKASPTTYSGGDGSSFEKAVVINAATNKSGVDAEYDYLNRHFPGAIRESQSLVPHDGKTYDVLRFKTVAGQKRVIYFEISSFVGKWQAR